jgi:hypothetical protein
LSTGPVVRDFIRQPLSSILNIDSLPIGARQWYIQWWWIVDENPPAQDFLAAIFEVTDDPSDRPSCRAPFRSRPECWRETMPPDAGIGQDPTAYSNPDVEHSVGDSAMALAAVPG